MTIDTRVLGLARHVLTTIRKRQAEYDADVANWYESGDGRRVEDGGKGYAYPVCIHGRSLWVDHDIPCGTCEMGEERATRQAVLEAHYAITESDRRFAWLAQRPREHGHPSGLPIELPGDTGTQLAHWASQPIVDLIPRVGTPMIAALLHLWWLFAIIAGALVVLLWVEKGPRFEHDCERCMFLGRFDGRDLYFCPMEPTVISRNSSDGGDYSSGIIFAEGPHAMPRLAEALRRARERGLYA